MTCDAIADTAWLGPRFDDRCYFYPRRDCPGWEPGKLCARIRRLIPADATLEA